MRTVGYILSIGGAVALIYSVINYINESESFSALGLDIAISRGNPTPMIISAIILVAGILIIRAAGENT